MLKLGIPLGAVRQALQKEGKDPSIVDMDPELSYLSQVKGNECSATDNDAEPLLKDDPELGKFFKVSFGHQWRLSVLTPEPNNLRNSIMVDAQNGHAAGCSSKCSQKRRKGY